MADNISTASGTLATDEVGGVHYPRSKVGFGVDGAYGDVTPANPLPIALPSGASTAAKQDAMASADDIFTIAPSDATDLTTIPKALLVTAAGNLAVRGVSGTTVTIPVFAGQIIPFRARRIMATNTTAAVVGLV